MTVGEFSEAVAHYCDEHQIEDENYFYTTINGVLFEVLDRFPIVKHVRYEVNASNSQTLVNMSDLVDDFASFSRPAFMAEEDFPDGRPFVDDRMGQIIFPSGRARKYILYYNQKIPTVTRDTLDIPVENERKELLILGTAYRLLIIDESYDAAASVKRMYDELAYRIEQSENKCHMPITDVYGW